MSVTTSALGIPHQDAWVELAYLKLDSWDGETASVSLDGLTLWSSALQYYEGSEVCGWNRGWSGSYDDRHDLSLFTPHTLDSLTLAASSTLDSAATDESFGIDDVFVWVR